MLKYDIPQKKESTKKTPTKAKKVVTKKKTAK
jgi:hypothetical protein